MKLFQIITDVVPQEDLNAELFAIMNYKRSYGPEGEQEWTATTYILPPTSSRLKALAKKLSNFPFKFFFSMYIKSPTYSYKHLKEYITLLRDFSHIITIITRLPARSLEQKKASVTGN